MSATFPSSVARAREYVACARTLFRDGFVRECHEYMVKALHLQVQAWSESTSAADGEPTERPELEALQHAGYPKLDRLRAAVRATESSAQAPSTDFDWIWAEVERLTRFSTEHALTPRARKLRRVRRIAIGVGSVLLALLVAGRLWGRTRVQASGIHSEPYPASHAIDGLEATEWILPDGAAGWVDLMFPTSRTVHRVRLLNAHNAYHADRAARAVRVTAFTAQGPAGSVEGAFKALKEERSELVLPLEASGVTRIRVEVLTHFRAGAGLAEIEVE